MEITRVRQPDKVNGSTCESDQCEPSLGVVVWRVSMRGMFEGLMLQSSYIVGGGLTTAVAVSGLP